MSKVVIIDYGMGNIDSVARAVSECGGNPVIAASPHELETATHIILPGVGSYSIAMMNLITLQFIASLQEQVLGCKIPFLGICLGMQLLAARGLEGGETPGLGFIDGTVEPLKTNGFRLRVPHIGWNQVDHQKTSPLFQQLPSGKDFYFVHSYYFRCENMDNILGTTNYGFDFASVVGNNENIFGTQFHPEKSQKTGFTLLANFLAL